MQLYPNQNSGLTSRVKKFGNLMKMGISVRISGDIQTGVKDLTGTHFFLSKVSKIILADLNCEITG